MKWSNLSWLSFPRAPGPSYMFDVVPPRVPSVDQSCFCLDCVTSSSISLHRSKVGSICAAEAVKSLQQPVLVREEPAGQTGGETDSLSLFLLSNWDFISSRQMRDIAQCGRPLPLLTVSDCPPSSCLPPPSPVQTARPSLRRRTRTSTMKTPLSSSKRRPDLRPGQSSPCQSRHSLLPVSFNLFILIFNSQILFSISKVIVVVRDGFLISLTLKIKWKLV